METINLQNGLLGENVNVAVVQLESPFYNELDLGLNYKNDDMFKNGICFFSMMDSMRD